MNIETLNNNILLVELSVDEMKELDITYENLNNQDIKNQVAIRKLLKRVDNKNHIENGGKVIIEALPIDGGGCFFIFTFTHFKKRYKLKSESVSFFSLKNLDDFLDLICTIRKSTGFDISINAYEFDKNYFVSIPRGNAKIKAILNEYGVETDKLTGDRVAEYGRSLGGIYLQ